MVSGTPVATPDAEPKLFVMSLRTMPLSVSTLTPLEPSPGYGPLVSSGISSGDDGVPLALDVPAAALEWPAAEVVSSAHAASARMPAPPSIVSARRRLSISGRSWDRPLSWSCASCSSSRCMVAPPSGASRRRVSRAAGGPLGGRWARPKDFRRHRRPPQRLPVLRGLRPEGVARLVRAHDRLCRRRVTGARRADAAADEVALDRVDAGEHADAAVL